MHISIGLQSDWLKSQKTDCSNPPQDFGPIKIQFWWSRVPLFLRCRRQAYYYFPTKFTPLFSARDSVDQCILTAEAPCLGWSKWSCISHGQSASCFFFIGSIAEPKVNSWSETTLQQLFQDWLLVVWTSNFSCFVHNHGICFLQVWCPAVFASSGHRVRLKFGLQDTLSCKVIKKCATLLHIHWLLSFETTGFWGN